MSYKIFYLLFGLLAIVYVLGLLVPLMDEDSAHHADIGLHMYLYHDYINLVDRDKDYLDKPHLLFWLAAFSYKIFGVTTFAFKFPSFLFTILGTYSTYRLGKLFYDQETGLVAALIVASSAAYILANNDVRMDSILTASIIFATWQIIEAAKHSKAHNLLLAALGMALAFSTKGMVGIIMPGLAVFLYLIWKQDWANLFHWKWLFCFFCLVVFMTPVLYAFYQQYDLHPEKTARNMTHISGVQFILWTQNLERMEGGSFGKKSHDYFYLFHTLLWAFLPWSLLLYISLVQRFQFFIKTRFKYIPVQEFTVLGLSILIFALISASNYKLPHYLNILFPFFALLVASHLTDLKYQQDVKTLSLYSKLQIFVALITFLIVLILSIWSFPLTNLFIAILAAICFCFSVYTMINTKWPAYNRVILISVTSIIFAEVLLNGHFYPQLIKYEAGTQLAAKVKTEKIPAGNIYFFNTHSFSFNFYNAQLYPTIDLQGLKEKVSSGHSIWILTNKEDLAILKSKGFKFKKSYSSPNFRVTRLNAEFLNPQRRLNACTTFYLIEIS